jgi:YD repeat-containing protein
MKAQFRAVRAGLLLSCILCTAALGDPPPDATYTYDVLGRLIRVEYTGGSSVTYNYDSAGNRTSVAYGALNHAPTANPDSIATTIKRAVTFDPRINDTDPDNDPLTISSPSAPSQGTVVVNSGQTLTYTPNPTFPTGNTGTDTFTYQLTDGHGHAVTGTVTMTVTDRPPLVMPDTVGAQGNATTSFLPMANDSDPDGDHIAISVPTTTPMNTLHGSVVKSGQQLLYTPNAGFMGTDTFSYSVSDGHSNMVSALETMNVGLPDQPPVAVSDYAYVSDYPLPHQTVTPWVKIDPRQNDTDADGDALTVVGVSQPASGLATATYTGTSVTYTYNTAVSNLDMTDTFTYQLSDGHNPPVTGTVKVTVYVEAGGDGGGGHQ